MLTRSYARAFRYGDYQGGFRAMRADCRDRRLELAVHNSSEAFKDEQVRALEFCLDDAAKYPEVKEIFQQAFTALKQTKAIFNHE